PSRSPWIAMRLRSRQTTCITGSQPACASSTETLKLDMWQLAPAASVTLSASTQPRNGSSRERTSAGSAESGGGNSAVTTNAPLASSASSLLPEGCTGASNARHPGGASSVISASQVDLP